MFTRRCRPSACARVPPGGSCRPGGSHGACPWCSTGPSSRALGARSARAARARARPTPALDTPRASLPGPADQPLWIRASAPVAGLPASGHPMPVRPCAESARGRARPGRPGLGRPGSMTMARPCPTGGGARRARLGAGVELVAQAAALQQVGRLLPHHRQPVLGRSTLLVRCRCPVPWGGRGCGQAVGDIGPAGLSVSRPTVRRVVVRPAVRASRDGRPFAVRCHG
jgi:hypothetical protein